MLPPGWELINSSAYTRVACNASLQLYYKEFLPRSPMESAKALLRGSRATRARKNAEALRYAGIAAPENIAWGKLPGRREYLFTRAAPGHGINYWLRELLVSRSGQQLQTRRTLLYQLGRFVGRMHATGFVHGDLRPGNILAAQRGEHFVFTLIDNESNLRRVPPPGRSLLRNLMQLNMLLPGDLSRTDRMRFFCAWRSRMRELSELEAKIVGSQAYLWAMQRQADKGLL